MEASRTTITTTMSKQLPFSRAVKSSIAERWDQPTFWTYGCGSEITMSAFLAITKCE